jgi:hypothetical protein
LTGLDASVSRLIPTVNQTVCWYTIYIYIPTQKDPILMDVSSIQLS